MQPRDVVPTRYPYQLNFRPNNSMTIVFNGLCDPLQEKSTEAVLAMEAALNKDLGLKSNEDYELIKSGFARDQWGSIDIQRPANAFIVLDYLLVNTVKKRGDFDLLPSRRQSIESKDCLDETSFKFMRLIAYCIENLSTSDPEKTRPLLRTALDGLQDTLLEETNFPKKLLEQIIETDDLFCHPLFQILSMLLDRNQNPHTARFISNTERPYDKIFYKYKYCVPDCYCDGIKKPETKTLNANKLRASRAQASSLTMGKK